MVSKYWNEGQTRVDRESEIYFKKLKPVRPGDPVRDVLRSRELKVGVILVALSLLAAPVLGKSDNGGLMNILTWVWTILLALATFGFLAVAGFFAFLCIYARNLKYSVLSVIGTLLFIFLFYMVLFQNKMRSFQGFNWYPLVTPFVIEVAIVAAIFIYLWKL